MDTKQFTLSPVACDEISAEVIKYCDSIGTDRKDVQRYRLFVEDCLLFWLDNGCEGKKIKLVTGRRIRRNIIRIEMEGESINPLEEGLEGFGSFCNGILSSLNLKPDYSYSGNKNRLEFNVQKKSMGMFAIMGISIISAILIGVLGKFFVPYDVLSFIRDIIINPINVLFYKVLGCVAGPMIFLSVCWGIYGIGDVETFGRIGKKILLSFIGLTFSSTLFGAVFSFLFFSNMGFGTGAGTQFQSVMDLITGIIPSNIFDPFINGNILQIIFLGLIIGMALLVLGKQSKTIVSAVEQLNSIVNLIMGIIGKTIPYVIIVVIVELIWSDAIDNLLSTWKVLAIMLLGFVIMGSWYLIKVSVRQKVNIITLIKKVMPGFLVSLTTASSGAAFHTNIDTCEKKYGINPSLTGFGMPLGIVMLKPISGLYFILLMRYVADLYEIQISPTWIGFAVILCTVIAVASPPVPGGGAICYTVLLAQLGLPSEILVILLAIDMITDFVITAISTLCLQMTLINESSKLEMIDKEVLRK